MDVYLQSPSRAPCPGKPALFAWLWSSLLGGPLGVYDKDPGP